MQPVEEGTKHTSTNRGLVLLYEIYAHWVINAALKS